MAALIHVKLTGEGDFGPVDLECAIPPARLPVVMAALFGQPVPSSGPHISGPTLDRPGGQWSGQPSSDQRGEGAIASGLFPDGSPGAVRPDLAWGDAVSSEAVVAKPPAQSEAGQEIGYSLTSSTGIDPAAFITGFMGTLGDLVARMQPRGFAETILIAAIWLHYRDGRGFVTRDDIRRILRRQEHLRMPRNFSRDFQVALSRGYLDPVESEDGYAVSRSGYQWFQSECL